MSRTNKQWTPIAVELMQIVTKAWNEMPEPPSLRTVAKALEVSPPRVMDLRDHKHGMPTVDEFINICQFLHLNPADVIKQALRNSKSKSNL